MDDGSPEIVVPEGVVDTTVGTVRDARSRTFWTFRLLLVSRVARGVPDAVHTVEVTPP